MSTPAFGQTLAPKSPPDPRWPAARNAPCPHAPIFRRIRPPLRAFGCPASGLAGPAGGVRGAAQVGRRRRRRGSGGRGEGARAGGTGDWEKSCFCAGPNSARGQMASGQTAVFFRRPGRRRLGIKLRFFQCRVGCARRAGQKAGRALGKPRCAAPLKVAAAAADAAARSSPLLPPAPCCARLRPRPSFSLAHSLACSRPHTPIHDVAPPLCVGGRAGRVAGAGAGAGVARVCGGG